MITALPAEIPKVEPVAAFTATSELGELHVPPLMTLLKDRKLPVQTKLFPEIAGNSAIADNVTVLVQLESV